MLISEINTNGRVYINLHMEQVYSDLAFNVDEEKEKMNEPVNNIQVSTRKMINCKDLTEKMVSNLSFTHLKDKQIIIDIKGITGGRIQEWEKLISIIEKLPNVKVFNIEEIRKLQRIYDKLKKYELEKQSEEIYSLSEEKEVTVDLRSYTEAFNYIYIQEKLKECCEGNQDEKHRSGVTLSKYINIKRIVECSDDLMKIAYMLSLKIKEKISAQACFEDVKPFLFFHTLNGAAIGNMISLLLDLDTAYMDQLGPYSKLQKINFYSNKTYARKYIVICDVVCLGNELTKAKDIINFIGGNYVGYATVVELETATLPPLDLDSKMDKSDNNQCTINLIKVNKQQLEELGYTIKTILCPCKLQREVE